MVVVVTNIQINTSITLESQQLLAALAQLTTAELETFSKSLENLIQQRKQENSLASTTHILPDTTENPHHSQPPNTLEVPIVESLIPKSFTIDGNSLKAEN